MPRVTSYSNPSMPPPSKKMVRELEIIIKFTVEPRNLDSISVLEEALEILRQIGSAEVEGIAIVENERFVHE